MISVRCPACGKLMAFEESDAGALIACPLCRQEFSIPHPTQTASDGTAPALPSGTSSETPGLGLPDNIGIAPDPDLDLRPELFPEVLEVKEEVTAPSPIPPGTVTPHLELDAPRAVEPGGTAGTPTEVKPTDLAPSLGAASLLSEALPPEATEPERPADVLEEVHDEEDRRDRVDRREEDDEEDRDRRRRRRPGRRRPEDRAPRLARPHSVDRWTRDRVLGAAGVALGLCMLLGTCAHHALGKATGWHQVVCCGDLFALLMVGVGLYFLFLKG
jgi:hypothetical protein